MKNEWLLEQLQQCNESILPGGKDHKSGKAMWALGKKLQRGVDKWRAWGGKNVRDSKGVLGTSPKENVKNFKDFYEDLFSNEVTDSRAADAWYEEMAPYPQDREWRAPILPELRRAVAELKRTAPGLSGIPSAMWKILYGNEECRECLLKIMVECWSSGTVPDDWTSYYLTVLPKKGDLTLPANYRGIRIGESLSKVHATILKHRLNDLYGSRLFC